MRLPSLSAALRTGASALRANPVRTLLATLGVVIGSAALVAVFAVSDGVERFARERVSSQGYDLVVVRPIAEDSVDGQWIPRTDVASLDVATLEGVARVVGADGRVQLARRGVALGEVGRPARRRAFALRGVALSAPDSLGASLVAGRHLTPEETRAGTPVAVVSEPLARAMLADSGRAGVAAALGDSLPVGGAWVRVVGVAAADPDAGRRQALSATVPLALAERGFVAGRSPAVPASLTVQAARAEETQALRGRVESHLARGDAAWKSRWRITAGSERQLTEIRRGMLIFRLMMGAFTGITLVVGGIGIMNVLLASVAERTREIGLRKAVGARRRDILLQFLAESVTITASGSVIGTALGLGTAYGVAAIMRAQTEARIYAATTVQTLLISAGAAVVVGLAFGCYPAMRAARLAPIEAIHTE